jgi:hypothetical protein
MVERRSPKPPRPSRRRSPGRERRRSETLNRSTLLLGGASYSGLVDRSLNRADRHRRNLRLILLRLFGFAIAVLLSFRHGRSPSIHIGSREADMARSRRRERTRTNKNAPSLHARSRACCAPGMCGRFTQTYSWKEVRAFLLMGRPGARKQNGPPPLGKRRTAPRLEAMRSPKPE